MRGDRWQERSAVDGWTAAGEDGRAARCRRTCSASALQGGADACSSILKAHGRCVRLGVLDSFRRRHGTMSAMQRLLERCAFAPRRNGLTRRYSGSDCYRLLRSPCSSVAVAGADAVKGTNVFYDGVGTKEGGQQVEFYTGTPPSGWYSAGPLHMLEARWSVR